MLERRNADVFFHADQLIRGIYEPFIAEWQVTLLAVTSYELFVAEW